MELKNGVILRDYRIVSLLGEGGMGEVYLAEETMLGRQVAIKRLNPHLTKDTQFSERFINEARIQAKLIHPHIVALHNFFVQDGVYYMVMEFAAGIMLKDLIARTGPIPEQRTLHIFRQLVTALSYAHSKQIIHRDIKPSNIVIDEHDNIKVMDFGIARLMSDKHLTRTGAKLGTLFYMSPEQVKALKDIDHRSDIYSAGIVLYEMLTGRLPYTADTDSDFDVMLEIVNNELPDPRAVYPHISDQTIAAMNKATQKQREQRYQDCAALHKDCEGVSGGYVAPKVVQTAAPVVKPKPVEPKPVVPNVKASPLSEIEMVYVEGGTFEMGAKPALSNRIKGTDLDYKVTLSSYSIGKYPITQKQWHEVMGSNPSHFIGADLPVETVSWYACVEFCNKLSQQHGFVPCYSGDESDITCDWSANGFRLPTEAEWEYAGRGGKYSKDFTYAGSNDIDNVAWYNSNSEKQTHTVCSKQANELGIFDMSGNLWEWCWDWYNTYNAIDQNNPRGSNSGISRVLRGGSWRGADSACRVSYRYNNGPNYVSFHYGLRLLKVAK